MKIKQVPTLTYREIDGEYYVTNIRKREVVVLNELAFRILEVADDCDMDDVCLFFSGQSDSVVDFQHYHNNLSREEVICFLEKLRTLSLIQF